MARQGTIDKLFANRGVYWFVDHTLCHHPVLDFGWEICGGKENLRYKLSIVVYLRP